MARVTWTVRRLSAEDAEASRQLGFEAFGVPANPSSEPVPISRPGRHTFGAFVGDTLAARLSDREFDSCFGGVTVATAGVSGVTVAAEFRGRGALTPLFAAMLQSAKERGAVLSTLFPTAPRIYRRFGYEVVAESTTVSVPTAALAAVLPATGTSTRRATEADVAAVRQVYDAWALEQNGPLTRRGASFTATTTEYLAGFTGVTLAEDSSGVVGYVSWNRGEGFGEQAVIAVTDLIARTPEAHRALLSVVGSFATVAPTTRIDTSGDDLARLFIPSLHWQVVHSSPYMLKVLDVPLALSARRYPPGLTAELAFSVEADVLVENDTSYVLQVGHGSGSCEIGGARGRTLTSAGLALLYAGAQSCANLRSAGHLRGGHPEEDLVWDALFGGRQRHIRNYF